MRMAVLILEPCFALLCGRDPAKMRIEHAACHTGETEQRATCVMKLPAIGVVETNQNITARLRQATDAGKGLPRIIGVMQHAIANNEIEEAVFQSGSKEIH